jgi:hypothetical protein
LTDLRRKGVEIIDGPLVHGPEGGTMEDISVAVGVVRFIFSTLMAIVWKCIPT